MHEEGNYYVSHGSILSRYNEDVMLDEDVTVVVDIDSGGLLKVGKKDWVTNYFNTMCNRYLSNGFPEMVSSLKLITFHVKYPEFDFEPEGYNFDIDEICTIINWFGNSIGEQMKWFLELPLDEAKAKIKKLQNIGF